MLSAQTDLEFRSVAGALKGQIHQIGIVLSLPHVLMRPQISLDGDQWCALYGDNLHDGVAGFGDSPSEAMAAFDLAWTEKLKSPGAVDESATTAYHEDYSGSLGGREILRDAIGDGALIADANSIRLMQYGYACVKTSDGRQVAIAARGGWMMLPGEIIRDMRSLFAK